MVVTRRGLTGTLATVLVLFALMILQCAKDKPSEPTLDNPYDDRNQTTRLLLESTPDSARIFLDGEDTGHFTPHIFMPIEAGTTSVILRKADYLDWDHYVVAHKGTLTRCEASLASAYGQLEVKSTPPSAMIHLDSNVTGHRTPWVFDQVPVGSHSVEVKLPGYLDWGPSEIQILSEQKTTVAATLASAYGCIDAKTDPPGATVYLDDIEISVKTPIVIPSVSTGGHTVAFSRNCCEDWGPVNVTVTSGDTAIVQADLVVICGSLYVESQPSGATIYLDGTDTGLTTPQIVGDIPSGFHTVMLKKDGYFDWGPQDVEIRSGETAELQATLISKYGSLNISSDPPGASIYLDDTDTGVMTPKLIQNVEIGSHTVTLTMEGYSDWGPETMVIASGETLTVYGLLYPEYGSLQVNSEPFGADIVLDDVPTGLQTPHFFSQVLARSHSLELTLRFFQQWGPEDVTVVEDQTTTVNADLVRGTGTISVTSEPSGCEIVLDGHTEYGWNTPHTFSPIDAGWHDIQIQAPSDLFADSTTHVSIDLGQSQTIHVQLRYTGPNAYVIMVGEPSIVEYSGDAKVLGQVKNIGSMTASYTKIFFTLKDSYGSIVGTDWCYADDTSLDPGEQCTFNCWAYGVPYWQVASVEWTITWSE